MMRPYHQVPAKTYKMITPPAQNNVIHICKFCLDDDWISLAVRQIREAVFGLELVWSCQECIDILECEDGEQQLALVDAQAERRDAQQAQNLQNQ